MSDSENTEFGRRLAVHTAPTLLGIKCGSLISLPVDEFDIDAQSRQFNRKALSKGLKMRVMRKHGGRALVLLYNERQLARRLSLPEVRKILGSRGYRSAAGTAQHLDRLCARMERRRFPHEIGVFLGYPAEDVEGFITNKGENYKLCGCWKVYGNAEKARRTFESYDRCRELLCGRLNAGADIYQALSIFKEEFL